MNDQTVPGIPRGVRLKEDKVRGGWSLLGPERVFQLDDIAVEILSRCDGTANLSAIEADLAKSFDVEASDITGDVREFLQGMAEKGMIELS